MIANLSDSELTKLIRTEIFRIENSEAQVPVVIQNLTNAGVVAGCHCNTGRTLNKRETLEWYAGQILKIASDKSSWFAMNTIINCLDKFAPES